MSSKIVLIITPFIVFASALIIRLFTVYTAWRAQRAERDCRRSIAVFERDLAAYALRDPALLHAEILHHIAEDFSACKAKLAARTITRRAAIRYFVQLERQTQLFNKFYDLAAADRADYSDRSNSYALLHGTLERALDAAIEDAAPLSAEQKTFAEFARAEIVRLTAISLSPHFDPRTLYAACALLYTRITNMSLLK